jgi:hypothetical protein
MGKLPWQPARIRRVLGVKPPPEVRGKDRRTDGIPELFMKMQLEDCYDVERGRAGLEELARRLRHIYDVERKWIIRPSGRPGWSRVWRVK